ncbi:hypothetical protein C5167_024211 [Papaver somniferum]|uniref:RRM domain-containing protein n=1 Tax=Papaver somniferum TaxID=3469 RepID=A0A4Y7JQY9_PAPSO|nr:hypothetical protein C5167_024211 [Papaver somniferum]
MFVSVGGEGGSEIETLVQYMSEPVEYRCFIGGLSWSTSDRGLKSAFEKYGNLVEAKVVVDKFSGRSRGFGFVTFDDKKAMDEAIDAMNGMDLDGRPITTVIEALATALVRTSVVALAAAVADNMIVYCLLSLSGQWKEVKFLLNEFLCKLRLVPVTVLCCLVFVYMEKIARVRVVLFQYLHVTSCFPLQRSKLVTKFGHLLVAVFSLFVDYFAASVSGVPLVSITIGKTGGFAGFNEKWLGLYFTCGVVDPGFTPKSKSANGPKFILCSVR